MKPSALIARLRELASLAVTTSSPQQLAEHVAAAITAIADTLEDAQAFVRAQMGQHLAELAPLLSEADRAQLQELFGADLVPAPAAAPASIEGLQVVEVPVATADLASNVVQLPVAAAAVDQVAQPDAAASTSSTTDGDEKAAGWADLGKIGYAAFAEVVTAQGFGNPDPFDHLVPALQAGWVAAAKAVRTQAATL